MENPFSRPNNSRDGITPLPSLLHFFIFGFLIGALFGYFFFTSYYIPHILEICKEKIINASFSGLIKIF